MAELTRFLLREAVDRAIKRWAAENQIVWTTKMRAELVGMVVEEYDQWAEGETEPPLTPKESELIGEVLAQLFRQCDAVRGTPAHPPVAARHDAVAHMSRRLDWLESERVNTAMPAEAA